MDTSDIDLMLAEKDNPCISILIATPRSANPRNANSLLIAKAINKAHLLLTHSAWPVEKVKRLEDLLDSLTSKIDTIRLQQGLAVFISPTIFKIYLLPFPVKEKVMLGKSFEIQDVLYYTQFLEPYYLLALSKKKIRLLKGAGLELQEVENADFPKRYVEEYEYDRPSVGTSFGSTLKAFEKDKSEMQAIRLEAFFKKSDVALDKYLKKNTRLFLAGVGEEVSSFEHISHHGGQLTGIIKGNYDYDAVHPLAEGAWKSILEAVKTQHKEWLRKLEEGIGTRMAVAGIRNVWRAAAESKGLVLLLEKDYHTTVYIDPRNITQLFLTPPITQHHTVQDAPVDVLKMVREKGGQVVVVDNGALRNFKQIALLLRYEESRDI